MDLPGTVPVHAPTRKITREDWQDDRYGQIDNVFAVDVPMDSAESSR